MSISMLRRLLAHIVAMVISVAGGAFLVQNGCGTGLDGYAYGDDCIGADGYNWCIAGGGWDAIHEPTVQPWDFTDY